MSPNSTISNSMSCVGIALSNGVLLLVFRETHFLENSLCYLMISMKHPDPTPQLSATQSPYQKSYLTIRYGHLRLHILIIRPNQNHLHIFRKFPLNQVSISFLKCTKILTVLAQIFFLYPYSAPIPTPSENFVLSFPSLLQKFSKKFSECLLEADIHVFYHYALAFRAPYSVN